MEPLDADQRELSRTNYTEHKDGPPREASAGKMEQLAAIHARVVFFHHEPHADFARLAPFGRRVQMALCHNTPHQLAHCSGTLELLQGPLSTTRGPSYQRVLYFSFPSLTPQQRDPSTGSQEVWNASPQALDNHHEALGELTVAGHNL